MVYAGLLPQPLHGQVVRRLSPEPAGGPSEESPRGWESGILCLLMRSLVCVRERGSLLHTHSVHRRVSPCGIGPSTCGTSLSRVGVVCGSSSTHCSPPLMLFRPTRRCVSSSPPPGGVCSRHAGAPRDAPGSAREDRRLPVAGKTTAEGSRCSNAEWLSSERRAAG